MKHTPGPWEIGRNLLRPYLRVSVHETEERGGWTIANCYMTVRPSEENMANARLIAAAPELLAACKSMVKFFDDYWGDDIRGRIFIEAFESGYWAEVKMTKEAIAAATEET